MALAAQEFEKRAIEKHGNNYNYDETIFMGIKNNIIVKCRNNHYFEVNTEKHISGGGKCPTCEGKNLKGFITEANILHKNKYDYSKVNYINTKKKIEILCSEHGSFWQTPSKHIWGKGQGCPKCIGRSSSKEFIEKSKLKFGDIYDYSLSIYKNSASNIDFICPQHGKFSQIPREHLKSNIACPKCRGCNKTTEEFISEANIIHKNTFDYTKAYYSFTDTKVEIICRVHGSFWQTPYSHLKGNGCAKCSKNTSKMEQAWLDSLCIPEENRHISIKISGYKRALIVDGYDPKTNTIYELYGDFWHGNPKFFDQNEKHRVKKKGTYGDVYEATMLREQRIQEEGYKLITTWESEWLTKNKECSK